MSRSEFEPRPGGYDTKELSRQLTAAYREPLQSLILINKIIFSCIWNSGNRAKAKNFADPTPPPAWTKGSGFGTSNSRDENPNRYGQKSKKNIVQYSYAPKSVFQNWKNYN